MGTSPEKRWGINCWWRNEETTPEIPGQNARPSPLLRIRKLPCCLAPDLPHAASHLRGSTNPTSQREKLTKTPAQMGWPIFTAQGERRGNPRVQCRYVVG